MTFIIIIVIALIIFGLIQEQIEKRKKGTDSPIVDSRIIINDEMVRKAMDPLNIIRNEEGDNTMEKKGNVNDNTSEQWDTFNLMESILTDLGCQTKKEDEKELLVAYQGENFIINIGGPYAQIWDPAWAQISVNDPHFEEMKAAVNLSNFDFGPSIVWTTPNEDGFVSLHSKRDILLCPQLQDKVSYMRSVLDSFFEKKERMRGQFHAWINQQQQSSKPHRPVGFATSEDEIK